MRENRQGDARAVVQAGMCTALAVILSMIGLYTPLFSIVTFMLIPLPIAYLGLRQGVRWSVIVTAGVMVLDSVFFGIVSAASICAMFSCLGVVLGACYQFRVSAVKTLAAGSIMVLAAFLLQSALLAWIMNIDIFHVGETALAASQKVADETLPQYYSGEMLAQAQQEFQTMMTQILRALPFSAVMASVMYAAAAMFICRRMFARLGVRDIPAFPPTEKWEMPRSAIYVYITGLAMKYAGGDGTWIGDAGYNLTLACMIIFWLQGVGVLWWLPHRWPAVRPVRWMIVIFGLIAPAFQMILFFAGLLDMAFNYRKRRGYQ